MYEIKYNRLKEEKSILCWGTALALILAFMGFIAILSGAFYESDGSLHFNSNYIVTNIVPLFFVILFAVGFTAALIDNKRKINNKIETLNVLLQKGKLVKDIPFEIELLKTNSGDYYSIPVVKYRLYTGQLLTLNGDNMVFSKEEKQKKKIDLLIDENNPNHYYIGFDINRKGGNLPTDYYEQDKYNTDDLYDSEQLQKSVVEDKVKKVKIEFDVSLIMDGLYTITFIILGLILFFNFGLDELFVKILLIVFAIIVLSGIIRIYIKYRKYQKERFKQ